MRAKLPFILALLAVAGACSRAEQNAHPLSPNLQQGAPITEGDLRYLAETRIMESFPVQLATTVKIENIGSRPAAVEFASGCPVLLRAYRSPDRAAPPAWDQAREVFCTQAIQLVTINPGEAREFTTRTDAGQILGDSLPNGRYFLTAVVNKTGWPLQLDAGVVDLAR